MNKESYLLLGLVFTVVGDAFRLVVCPNKLRPLAIAGDSRNRFEAYSEVDYRHTTLVANNPLSYIQTYLGERV